MANTILLPNGRIETVFNKRDFLELVDEYMGSDACRWMEEWLAEKDGDADYVTYLEKEADSLRVHHKEVMEKLWKESEIIAGLIRKKEIDRKALSTAAGNIGSITWREAGR